MEGSKAKQRPSRLLSLDLLRGLTIAFMILVNNPGNSFDAYQPLQHAWWNGFTPTDLVFPTFLFLVGISTVFSLGSRRDRGLTRKVLCGHVLRRAALLYLFGLLVNTFPFLHLDRIRFYGVLPRIALCYLVISLLFLLSEGWKSKAVLLTISLAGYWALLRFVPVPGYGVPTHDIPLLDRDGNLAAWLDRALFAPQHLYERTRDPEGLLSTLPALGTALMGMLTGLWLRSQHALKTKVAGVAAAGTVSALAGLAWNVTLPINKKMWTSSYVLFAGGLSLLLLALSMLLVDVPGEEEPRAERSRRSGWLTPLLVFGTNSIAAYVFSELLAAGLDSVLVRPRVTVARVLWQAVRGAIVNPHLASLAFASSFVVVCWLPIYVLYRKHIFLKV